MSDTEIPAEALRASCPECRGERLVDVLAHHRTEWQDNVVWCDTDYRILRCRGCEAVFFQHDMVFSEEIDFDFNHESGEPEIIYPHKVTYWPSHDDPTGHVRAMPFWAQGISVVDQTLSGLFADIYTALNTNLPVLCAIGMRTVFDRASEVLNVDSSKSFADKLRELVALGHIGARERESLDVLTDAGNAAAHRGWRPTPEHLETMLTILESFLRRAFIVDTAAQRLRAAVPRRPARDRPMISREH